MKASLPQSRVVFRHDVSARASTPVMATTPESPGLLTTFPDLPTGLRYVRQVFEALPCTAIRVNPLTSGELRRVENTIDWYENLMFVHGWSAMTQDILLLRYYIFLKRREDIFTDQYLRPIVSVLGLAVRHDYEESSEVIIREGLIVGRVYNFDLHRTFLYNGLRPMPGVEVDWDQIFFTMLRVEHARIDDGGTLILTLVYGSLQRVRALLHAGASKSTRILQLCWIRFPEAMRARHHRFTVHFNDTPLSFAVRNNLEGIFPEKFRELNEFELTLQDRCLIAIRRSLRRLTRARASRLGLPNRVQNDILFRWLKLLCWVFLRMSEMLLLSLAIAVSLLKEPGPLFSFFCQDCVFSLPAPFREWLESSFSFLSIWCSRCAMVVRERVGRYRSDLFVSC